MIVVLLSEWELDPGVGDKLDILIDEYLIIILQLVFAKKNYNQLFMIENSYFGDLFIFIKNNSINYARFLFFNGTVITKKL